MGGLLCVHAHPDDEAIATGGVLLRAAAAGRATHVLTCTGGELGEIVGRGMNPEDIRPRLAEVRRAELAESLAHLGAGEPHLLGYRDSDMRGRAGNMHPEAFWQASFDAAVGRVVEELRAVRPDVVVTYDAFGIYGHPDHIQAHRVTVAAAEASGIAALYPEAGPPWRVPKVYLVTVPQRFVAMVNAELGRRGLASPFATADGAAPVGTPAALLHVVVDVRDHLDAKVAALRAHRSQLGPGSFFLNMPEDLTTLAFGEEWFIRLRSDVEVPHREDDLFTGIPRP